MQSAVDYTSEKASAVTQAVADATKSVQASLLSLLAFCPACCCFALPFSVLSLLILKDCLLYLQETVSNTNVADKASELAVRSSTCVVSLHALNKSVRSAADLPHMQHVDAFTDLRLNLLKDNAKEGASNAADQTQKTAADAKDTVKDKAGQASDKASDIAGKAQVRLDDWSSSEPLEL